MPRTFKLTWQPGTHSRLGRWKKKYKGKAYYFAGGGGKYDREAYEIAVAEWEALKHKIDAEAPRRFEIEHHQAAEIWEQVLAWSNRHAEREMAALANEKLALVRQMLTVPELAPLSRADTLDGAFDLPTISLPEHLLDRIDWNSLRQTLKPIRLDADDRARYLAEIDGSPSRISREIWRDRLAVQNCTAAQDDESVGGSVERFLKQKRDLVSGGELSAGRLNALRLQLSHFQDWIGKDSNVEEITGSVLLKYHASLLASVKAEGWSKNTAFHYLSGVKSFVRWLWQTEAIDSLPRVIDSRSELRISRPTSKPIVCTEQEIKKLLKSATRRTKLYILLMLNCGMTQKDISDLKMTEVDWKAGRIIRKRSKTAHEDNVPEVNYLLWRQTFRLLKQERNSSDAVRALTNSQGGPLWSERVDESGKYQKTDNVKNAFDRLRKQVDIEKPLKSLKKASATLLRSNEKFQGLEGLFLGHAPQSMSDKHYTQIPQQLLDSAVNWLGDQFKIK